jgi:hypothetical protein
MIQKLFIALFFITSIAVGQSDCDKFKVGKFQNVEEGVVKSSIVRNDSIQVEKFGDREIKLRINWLDDCSYQLSLLEGNEAFWKSRPKDMPTPDMVVRIVSVDGDAYLQEARLVTEEEFKYKSRIEKIE